MRVFPKPRPARMSQESQSPSGGSWESRECSDQKYFSSARFPRGKATLVGARSGVALYLRERFEVGGDGIYAVDAG